MKLREKDLFDYIVDQSVSYMEDPVPGGFEWMLPRFRESVLKDIGISMTLENSEGEEYIVSYKRGGELSIRTVGKERAILPEARTGSGSLVTDEEKEAVWAKIRKTIFALLGDICFSQKASGTAYLVEGVILTLSLKNEAYRMGVTKEIYPYIADIFDVSISSVERNIRMAIENAWSKMSGEYVMQHYPYQYTSQLGRPTNQEFLFALAGMIRENYPEYVSWCQEIEDKPTPIGGMP